jgi:ATP phosphoribosyltransferase regulatory subunit
MTDQTLNLPIPPGTRDVLPDEMRELRRVESSLRETFERFGFGEVATPAIEYDQVLARGGAGTAPTAYRFFDESGQLLALRTDMTVPIARLVATRYRHATPPFRFSYVGSAYRTIRPQRGQMREFSQAGVELIGAEAPEGTAEVIEVLVASLDAAGLNRAVIGLGDAELYRQLLDELGAEGHARDMVLDRLAEHDLVGLEIEIATIEGLDAGAQRTLLRLPELRGGLEVLEQARELGGEAVERATRRLAATFDAVKRRGVDDRVRLDLGLLRDLGYYTGAILEVYDPSLGHVIGGGGRYDDLTGHFGRPLPAAGFALYLERLHIAQAEGERLDADDESGVDGGSR